LGSIIVNRVWIDKEDLFPRRVFMKIGLFETYTTTFSGVKMNQAIDPGLFEYSPPKDAKVFETKKRKKIEIHLEE
jgi:outer membrane lipoprotein-sorting protein